MIMRVEIKDNWEQVVQTFEALPIGLRLEVYGQGLLAQARWAAQQSRRLLVAQGSVSKGIPTTNKGEPRKHLADSIVTARVGWRFDGQYIPRAAALVVAEQPHAHLVELGTVKTDPKPFLAPPIENGSVLLEAYKRGAIRYQRSLFKRLDKGKITSRERQLSRI